MKQARDVEKRFNEVSRTFQNVSTVFEGVGSSLTQNVTTPLAAAGGAALKFASDSENALAQFAGATGIDTASESLERYEGILQEIYKDNFGESIEDVANAAAKVKQNMDYLDDSALQRVTEYAYTLADTFEVDVAESTRAADTLIKNFGVSAREAFNLMSQGAQQGLDFSGELFDNIDEYSVQFQKLGLSAEDMFNIFSAGAENGAFNLDKIGDAVKEFSIRAVDGSDTTRAGFEALGLDVDATAQKFAAGGDSARDAFQQVISGLAEIQDPVERNEAGVNLFGTMWEDLGETVILSLNQMEGPIDQTRESMEALVNTRYDTLSASLSALWRTIQTDVLQPIGTMLIPYVETAIDKVGEFVDWWNQLDEATKKNIVRFGMIAAAVGPVLLILGKLSGGIGGVISSMGSLTGAIMRFAPEGLVKGLTMADTGALKAGSAIKLFGGGLQSVLGPIGLVAVAALLIYRNWDSIAPIFEKVGGKLQEFWTAAQPLLTMLGDALEKIGSIALPILDTAFQVAFSAIGGYLSNFLDGATEILENATTMFNGLIDFITGVFTGNWELAWNGLRDIVAGAFGALEGLAKTPINAVIGLVNGAIDRINSIQFTVPEWVPGLGGKGWNGLNIPHIPTLYTGTANWPGGLAEINEPKYGGEIVDLPGGTRVYPHDESVQMARAEGSRTITVNIPKLAEQIIVRSEADIDKIAEALARKLEQTAYNMA